MIEIVILRSGSLSFAFICQLSFSPRTDLGWQLCNASCNIFIFIPVMERFTKDL